MIFTRFLGDLKVETEDCSPGVLISPAVESCCEGFDGFEGFKGC